MCWRRTGDAAATAPGTGLGFPRWLSAKTLQCNTPNVRVRLLGPVSAEVDGARLNLGGLKQRAVFALLALNAGHVVSLDRLVQELWSDQPPSRSTLTLQSYISRLRRILSSAATNRGTGPQILTRPPGWILTVDSTEVDTVHFADLVNEARQLLGGGLAADPSRASERLQTALGLWYGAALADLESISFAREEAARLDEIRLSAVELLLEARLARGESGSVAEEARRFVDTNPFRERAWCALMLGLYRCGRQSEAIAAAAELRRVLADELGLDLSPEVQNLRQLILRQDPGLNWVDTWNQGTAPQSKSAASPQQAAVAPAPATPSLGQQLLVGRTDVLSTLDECVTAAADGRGRLLVLNAPAGCGKSTMLDALAQRMRDASGVVVRGGGAGSGAMPPLWPWVSIARQLATSGASNEDSHVGVAIGTALELLEPDTPATRSGGEEDAQLARTRLYRSVIDMLAAVRSRGPMAVLFDDAHWIDPDTLTLLSLAVDALAGSGVLFALAARSDEAGSADVAERISSTRREIMTSVPLRAFVDSEVAELVNHISGDEADPAVAVTICERTAGNPLFVTEMVRLLSSERRLDAKGVAASLPGEVRDVLRRRLNRLPEQTVALLTVAGAVHGSADVPLLSEVTGLDTETVLDGCESAMVAGLLVEDEGRPDRFALSHDLVRQTLEESLSRARQVRLHARIAAAIEASGTHSPEQTVALARHLTIAAPLVGPAAAVPYLVAASDDALTRFANEQAEQNLHEALALVARVLDPGERSSLEGPLRGRLALLEANVRGIGATPTSAQGHEPSVSVAPPTTPEATAGWLGAMVMASISGDMRGAVLSAQNVLEMELPPIGEASARFVLGFTSSLLGHPEVASVQFCALEELFAAGLDMDMPGTFSIPVAASIHEALLAHVAGDEAAAGVHLTAARARSHGLDRSLVLVEQGCSWVAAMRGDATEAHVHATACMEIAQRLSYPIYNLSGQLIDAWADVTTGDASRLHVADASCADIVATDLRMLTPFYLLLCAEAHAAIGDVSAARNLVRQSRAVSATSGDVLIGPRLAVFADGLVPSG